jgi:hypothetical protein
MFLSNDQLRCLEQLAKDKGEIAACRNCGSERVGVDAGDSDWALGLSFRVALSCPDCGAGAGDFYITAEEARGCGIVPDANLHDTPEAGL